MDTRLEKAKKMLQDAQDDWDKAAYECGIRAELADKLDAGVRKLAKALIDLPPIDPSYGDEGSVIAGWQLIETAPKTENVTLILGNKNDVSEGWWKDEYWHWHGSDERECIIGHWVWAGDGKPTHWQPMPEPPK